MISQNHKGHQGIDVDYERMKVSNGTHLGWFRDSGIVPEFSLIYVLLKENKKNSKSVSMGVKTSVEIVRYDNNIAEQIGKR